MGVSWRSSRRILRRQNSSFSRPSRRQKGGDLRPLSQVFSQVDRKVSKFVSAADTAFLESGLDIDGAQEGQHRSWIESLLEGSELTELAGEGETRPEKDPGKPPQTFQSDPRNDRDSDGCGAEVAGAKLIAEQQCGQEQTESAYQEHQPCLCIFRLVAGPEGEQP